MTLRSVHPAEIGVVRCYGHSKAEYVASAVEGGLILVAAVAIGRTAWERLLNLQPLEYVWFGLAIALVAAGVNGAVAVILLRAGRRLRSIGKRE